MELQTAKFYPWQILVIKIQFSFFLHFKIIKNCRQLENTQWNTKTFIDIMIML